MGDSTIQLPAPESRKLDTEQLVVGANTVERERPQVAGKAATEIAEVKDTDPDASHHGLVVRGAALVSPQDSTGTAATVAAGATGSVDSTAITSSKTGKLLRVEASSSVPFKAEIQTVLNGAATTRAVRFGRDVAWVAPHKDSIQQAESATAGFDGFRVLFTNLDTGAGSADFHASFVWDEV